MTVFDKWSKDTKQRFILEASARKRCKTRVML
ncbi:Uncharacterised protein [Vibrio cholerae]|nr:Uncharacterised protein [Vibrio cholerae]